MDECCEQAKAARHRGSCPRWYVCTFPPPQYRFTCCTREKGVAHGAMSHTQETNTIYGTLLHFGSLFFFSLIINRRTALWRPVTRWTRDSSTSCWPRRGVASPQSSVDASPLSPLVFPAFSSKWPPASSCPGMILGKQPGAAAIQQSKRYRRRARAACLRYLCKSCSTTGACLTPCVGSWVPNMSASGQECFS